MNNSTIYPAPPSLNGLIWRPITHDNLAELVVLARMCYQSDGGLYFLFEPDEIDSRFFPDKRSATIGAFTANGQLVACNVITVSEDSSTLLGTIIGHVHPDMRRKGLGNYLMRWSLAQAESLLVGATIVRRVLQIRTESLTETANRLYDAYSFRQKMTELVMRRDLDTPLPDSILPAEVTFTNWRPDLADQFFQAYHAAFHERPGFPGYKSTTEWVDSWTNDHFRPDWSILAHMGDTPLGFLTATDDPPHGFIMQVGVIPTQRRRGIGSKLMIEVMRRMQIAGAASTQLTVNINNPGAIQTYTRLGFVTIGQRARYERIVEQ